jgi:hypothetical protein
MRLFTKKGGAPKYISTKIPKGTKRPVSASQDITLIFSN